MSPAVVYRSVVLAAVLVLAGLLTSQLLDIVLAVIVALILSIPLAAAADLAERRHLPRVAGALAALLAVGGLLSGLGFLLLPQFVRQAGDFATRLPTILESAQKTLHGLPLIRSHSLATQLSNFISGYLHHPVRLLGPLEQAGLQALTVVLAVAVVLIAAFLIALNPKPLTDGVMRLLPETRHPQAREIFVRVRSAWLGWMTAIGFDMVVLGGLLFIGMVLVGLPFALGFAVFSAFMTVIPNYGSIISAVPPVLLGLSISLSQGLLVAVVYVIVNQIEGNLILPLIMAQRVELHPAVVALGLLVMGSLFGLVGILIAVPLLSLFIIGVQVLWVEPQERGLAVMPKGGVVESPGPG